MLNINDYGLITAEDVVGQYHAFGPSADTYLESACVDGACTSSCMATTDSADCGTSCAGGCNITCIGSSNASSVPADCSVCTSTCVGNCSGSCIGGCGDANCEGQCSLTCESMCSVNCDNLCLGTCTGHCYDTCVNGCKDACTGGCANGCHGCTGCSGGCVSACVDGCKYSCMNVSTADGTSTISPHMPESISTLRDMGIIQTDTMPEPSAELNNKIYQYIGTSTDNFTNGDFYKCVNTEINVYVWRNVTDTDVKAMLTDIVKYLNELSQYRYTRISELPESVIIQDGDTFAANATYTDEELSDMHLVIANVDNRTVRVSAASLMNYVLHNYQNNWAWTPVPTVDPETGAMTVIDWEYQFWENKPQTINLADLITGGVGRVTDEGDGLMPHEMYTELKEKEVMDISFITGKHRNGETATGVPVLRFNSQDAGAININASFAEDLMNTFAQSGDFLTRSVADTLYATIRSEQDLHSLLRYVMGPDSVDPTEPADLPSDQQLLTVNIPALYLTKADAASNYAPKSIASSVETLTLTVGSLQTEVSHFPDTYMTSANADLTYVAIANSTTQIPARVPASSDPQSSGTNGLMTPGDVANISSALDDITTINGQISDIYDIISAYDPAGYATDQRAGIVKVPTTSSIKVSAVDGSIDLKKYGVNNLIRNSIFSEGFGNAWDDTDIDTASSGVNRDTTIDRDIASIAIVADGVLSQEFTSDIRDGFTVGILFKKSSAAKTIEVKIDSANYVSHTIPSGSGYYIAEFYFTGIDDTEIDDHTLYIHNPDTSNTVLYEMSEIMVQNGKKFTGWNRNPYDISGVNSINILSYDNYIAFKDRPLTYTEDVYAPDGVTIIHHAGDPINPSSSIIMHKDQQYMYMHITALNQIDGQIRQDVIPLRINLTTGACDISGNAVSAGTLIDNTGELVPTVAEINAMLDGTALSLVDVANEETVSTMPEPDETYLDKVVYYTGTTGGGYTQNTYYRCVFSNDAYSWQAVSGYTPRYKYALVKTVDGVTTEIASVPHVGRFTGINNAEIFNDYVGNTADTAFTHVEGQGNSALQSATNVHIEGAGNTATGSAAYTHIEGTGNTAENGAAYNHIEGTGHKATGSSTHSHIEGISNTNMQSYDHIEGYGNIGGNYSNHSCGSTMPNGNSLFRSVIVNALPSISYTYNDEMYLVYDPTNRTYTAWDVNWSSGEGVWENNGSISLSSGGAYGHVEGQYNLMGTTTGHVEGSRNILKTSCDDTHIEGANNIVYEGSNQTHVEGKNHVVYNGVNYSHFEGLDNRSGYTGEGSGLTALHMEGQLNIASSGTNNTHMEGYNNAIQLSGGNTAHIEGYMNRPSQTNYSHIEGYKNTTTSYNYILHLSGALNTVNGGHVGLHVEGKSNVVPYGKSSIDASTDAITGNDVGGHIEGVGNSLELNPNVSGMGVGSGYHIEGSSNIITYKDHSNNVVNSGSTLASYDHIEGYNNRLATQNGYGKYHIEGSSNWASGESSHVEGGYNKGYNLVYSHVEGNSNTVSSASGTNTTLYGIHVEGQSNTVYGIMNGSHIEGGSNTIYSNNDTYQLHVEGSGNTIGSSTVNVSASYSHIEGRSGGIDPSVTYVTDIHIEGNGNKITKISNLGNTSVYGSHVEGTGNKVNANYSHVEGYQNEDHGDGYYNHVEGYRNVSHGQYSHTEGTENKMYGSIGHVEGANNTIGAYDSTNHQVTSYANHSHVEGVYNTSLNSINHIEGGYNTGYGVYDHIEGQYNEAHSNASHTAGLRNINNTDFSAVIGVANEPDTVYDTTSIIPADITVTDNRRIITSGSTMGQLEMDGTLGVTDFIKLPYSPMGFHFVGTTASNASIGLYDENKDCITTVSISGTGDVDMDAIPNVYNRDAVYIRLCAVISSSSLNDAELYIMKEPHLFTVGNGDVEGSTVNTRSNILEVSYNKININGDIYQNGSKFNSGTPHFVGTSVEWEALTTEEKAQYEGGDIVFTDDNAGIGIVDTVVTQDSPNPVSGGAVYDALTDMSRPYVSNSTNNYYIGRRYYDGRLLVHYRRVFSNVSLTANAVTEINLGDWSGIDTRFNNIITNAFTNNNNVTYMTIIKDASSVQICQINKIGVSNNNYVAYVACLGSTTYSGDITIDICIDSY